VVAVFLVLNTISCTHAVLSKLPFSDKMQIEEDTTHLTPQCASSDDASYDSDMNSK
jgi:hypothetical protein